MVMQCTTAISVAPWADFAGGGGGGGRWGTVNKCSGILENSELQTVVQLLTSNVF